MYLICYLLGIGFFFQSRAQGHFGSFSAVPKLPWARDYKSLSFVTKKVPVPFATVRQFSPQQINCQSLYGPITDSYLFWGTSLANFALNLKKKGKKKNKKNKNRDSSNRHRFLSLPTRRQQISQIKMGLLRRRLIFAKDFDMNKFSMDKIWSVSTLEDTRCITFVCLPLGYTLVMCYITHTSTFWQLWHFMHWDSGCLSQLLIRDSAFTSESWLAPWGG